MAAVPYSEVANLTFSPSGQQFRYGTEAEHKAEYWSAAPNAPLLVLIHGGCWLNQYNLEHIRPLASTLADSGIAVLSIEYRRIGDSGGGWPGTFDDISLAMDFAAKLGHKNIFAAGHSAGGHLALWLAATHPNKQLKGAIGLAAISDLATYSKGSSSCQRATATLLGGTVSEVPDRYAKVSPIALEFDRPIYLIHGSQDPIVSISQSEAFCEAKNDCELSTLSGVGHFDVIDPRQPVVTLLIDRLHSWLPK